MNIPNRIVADRTQARSLGDQNADVCFLSVVDNGRATVRTLVLRDIVDNRFTLFVNRSSPKYKALASGASFQLLLWYQALQRQYRVSGTFEEMDNSVIQNNWHRRPRGSKYLDYVYEELGDQSTFIESRATLTDKVSELKSRYNEDNFEIPPKPAGIALIATEIEALDLNDKDRIHDRQLFTQNADGEWTSKVMIP